MYQGPAPSPAAVALLGLVVFLASACLAMAVIRRYTHFRDRLPVLLSLGAAAITVLIIGAVAQRLSR